MRAIFLDRDGTVTKSTKLVTTTEELELEKNAAAGIKMMNEAGFKVIIVTNQPQIARGMCTEDDVRRINAKVVEDLEKEGAFIDAVYYCPHHPEQHDDVPEEAKKYRLVCECRKPEAGMMREAAKEYGISLKDSYIIGDRTVDTLAGINAGCKTVMVRTGHAGLDRKHDVVADMEAEDLLDAAKMIRMERTKAIILVGGKGERLGHLTKDIPKPLIPVGGKPVVQHQIELLRDSGVKNIVLCGSYLINRIKDYFGNGEDFGVNIIYTHEPEPMGTGGAVKLAEHLLKDTDTVLLLSGDIMVKNVDFHQVVDFHKSNEAIATMIVRDSDHPKDSDVVKLDEEGRVVDFIGKGQEEFKTGNTGLFVLNKKFFDFIPEGNSNIEKHILSKIYRYEKVFGFKIKEGWLAKDMGTIDRLESVRKAFGE